MNTLVWEPWLFLGWEPAGLSLRVPSGVGLVTGEVTPHRRMGEDAEVWELSHCL